MQGNFMIHGGMISYFILSLILFSLLFVFSVVDFVAQEVNRGCNCYLFVAYACFYFTSLQETLLETFCSFSLCLGLLN